MIPKIIFIIPYRDRYYEMEHFKVYMNYILEDIAKTDYEIFFIHQLDNRPFNRGAMKNIGFISMKNKYPNDYKNICFIFHDIDTLPAIKNTFNYITKPGFIKHFYGFKYALGGIFSITGNDFEKIKGFPNYWAWGLEDNDILIRAKQNKVIIDYSEFCDFKDNKILKINNSSSRTISKQQVWRAGSNSVDNIDKIFNLKYNINNNMVNVLNFNTHIDPSLDHYVNQNLNENIKVDANFIPSDSVNKKSDLVQNTEIVNSNYRYYKNDLNYRFRLL